MKNRRTIYIQGNHYIAEFPKDPAEGFIANRRGIRRRLALVSDFDHLTEKQTHDLLLHLWRQAERKLRQEQADLFSKSDREQRNKKKLTIRHVATKWLDALKASNSSKTCNEYIRSIDVYIKAIGDHQVAKFQYEFATSFIKTLKKL